MKRIAVYNLFHKQMMKAFGVFYSTYEFGSKPDLNKFNREDIEEYLKEKKLRYGTIQELLESWDNKKNESIQKITNYLYKIEPKIVDCEIIKAN